MRSRLRLLAAAGLATGLLLGVVISLAPPAEATRNSGGTYSLPPGNPVVPGTPISSSWANTTLGDIATEITNSLDRQGRGAMQAPLQLSNGTAALPGLTFGGDPDTGFYHAAGNSAAMSMGGAVAQTWTSAGTTIPGTLGVTGALSAGSATVSGNITTGSASVLGNLAANSLGVNTNVRVDFANANNGTTSNALLFGATGVDGIGSAKAGGPNLNGLDFYTSGTARLSITNAGGVRIPGAYVANPGAPIAGSYAATVLHDWPFIGFQTCTTADFVLNGATQSATCMVSSDIFGEIAGVPFFVDCIIAVDNLLRLRACNASTGTNINLPPVSFRVRTFQ